MSILFAWPILTRSLNAELDEGSMWSKREGKRARVNLHQEGVAGGCVREHLQPGQILQTVSSNKNETAIHIYKYMYMFTHIGWFLL